MAGERLFASEVSVIIKERNLIKQLRPYIEEKEERIKRNKPPEAIVVIPTLIIFMVRIK